jgi:hypothetical protein
LESRSMNFEVAVFVEGLGEGEYLRVIHSRRIVH